MLALSLVTTAVVGLALSPSLLSLAPAGTVPDALRLWITDFAAFVASLFDQAWHWVRTAHRHTPALALGITVAALALPLVLIGAVVRALSPPALADTLPSDVADGDDEDIGSPAAGLDAVDRTGHARPRRVWLAAEAGGTLDPITRELTRIGSAPDNEIRIKHSGAERYHAAIARSPEFDHYLVALTADLPTLLNGAPVTRRRLRDGDVITIGAARLVFRAGED